MKLSRLLFLALVLGVAVLCGIVFYIGYGKIAEVLATADYAFVAAAAGLQALGVGALVLRWKLATDFANARVSKARLLLISLAGIAFTNLTPASGMGGEPVKIYFLKKAAKIGMARSFATVVVERLFDAFSFAGLCVVTIISAFVFWSIPGWALVVLIVAFLLHFSLLAFVTVVSLNPEFCRRCLKWAFKHFGRIIRKFRSFDKSRRQMDRDLESYGKNIRAMFSHKSLWISGIMYSFLIWALSILRTVFVFAALGTPMSFHLLVVVAMVLVFSSLAGLLPFIPGGLAVTEAMMVLLYASAGVSLALAGMVAIIDRLVSFWALTFAGMGAAYYLGIQDYEKTRR